MKNDSVFLQAIEDSLINPAYEQMQGLPNIDHEFSDEYCRKIDKLTKKRRKSYYPIVKTSFRKVACLISAIIIMSAVSVAAVPAVKEWFAGLFVLGNEGNIRVHMAQGDVQSEDISKEFATAEPTYIPDGFDETERIEGENTISIVYSSDEGLDVIYTQDPITTVQTVNTENRTIENIKIGDYDAIVSYDNESSTLIWTDGTYSYCIDGYLCKSDIIHMANSVNFTK